MQPKRNLIGATKDIAAAGVSLAILAWRSVLILKAWRLVLMQQG